MTSSTVAAAPARHRPDALTVGVEEEFLLVDRRSGAAAPAVAAVLAEIPPELRGQVQREFQTSQIEIGSPPGLDLRALRRTLGTLRAGVADAAERAGVRLIAVGTAPVAGPQPDVVDDPRFHRIVERYGMLLPGPGTNGLHVHVAVPDQQVGVQVLNHLRPWLPVLQATTANSPFFHGVDTGYASWRSVMWQRWPAVAPAPRLRSYEHYRSLVDDLTTAGLILDEGMLHWYARLSAHYPTVEVRIGDVCPSLDDTILLAALVRGLVGTALTAVEQDRPPVDVEHHVLVAAHWRAAHDGLEGQAVDLTTGAPALRPGWHLLRRLVDTVRPELDRHGDVALVNSLLGRLRARGTGAARQRAVHAGSGDLGAVVDYLAAQTRSRSIIPAPPHVTDPPAGPTAGPAADPPAGPTAGPLTWSDRTRLEKM
ncbi:glutamate--cysteine ligase [Solwaraspora sp. WMMD792]|uniref:carboxylate-amine ligase n=1 Tax=Solwaraspora sp. WMMD792 TaxID=3016099 RepID=UPI002416C21D|nr:glutamate--cysteine ligase [Solwaraspora sp. WMMD792]MDG4769342.1 glutamate--cysteine ligase [Solwaraspora sp. WMMD792]